MDKTPTSSRRERPKPIPGRSVVATRHGVVAASQPLAAAAGVQALLRGGNAVDAAISANATMGVLEPTGNGVGGDLFALVYHAASGQLHGLNASGWSPAALTVDVVRAHGFDAMPSLGVHSVTVPGAVGGWSALRERFGRLSFRDLMAPAIHYADAGFPVAPITAGHWARSRDLLAAHPNAAATFMAHGRPPGPAEVFRNPDLACTLGRIARLGPAGFYEGEVADAMVAVSRDHGGTLSHADLTELRAEWVDPIATDYRGWTVYQIGPQTQGIAALIMLGLMERFPLRDYGFHSADALHVMIEAKKLAYADMIAHVGDPRFARVPTVEMLDPAQTGSRAGRIAMGRAMAAAEPSRFHGITDRQASQTIYLATADRAGNMVSLIQSNYEGFGSGLVPPGTGFMLQNRGALFTLEPGHPNMLEPRKRPLHTIIPGFMERDGVRIAFGIMGGWNQAQAHAQFVADIVDFDLDIQQALEAGRFTKSTFHGRDVDMETLVPAATRQALEARGHVITTHGPRTSTFGYGQAIMSSGGVNLGASDPRHDGAAIPEPPDSLSTHTTC